ncbi:hypothetical protein VSS74_23895 [Conexibacter stalactiti]|uniref:Peptidase S1 domain-containing protein n=1 Tax=Conexibacter stalactiti TaxID=1940611 RepID=A0ABU4HXK1_9ACTN|nr:hypothetical protein [Conexibacter stalactiti]MDW5597412.1 hypothetical protein [Conexibacter stalactiti]MEC5038054.1 hypothetical protein [Conexibacter stalactiti]
MKRIATAATAALLAAAFAAPAASAATGVVSNGIAWTTHATPDPDNPNDYCTLGAVGTDSSGNKVGISAVHCIWREPDGATVYRWARTAAGRTPIGRLSHRGDYSTPPSGFTADWVVMQLNDDAVLTSNGPGARITGIAPATLPSATIGCKDGITSGVTCGLITAVSTANYWNLAYVAAGDSGGPFFVNDHDWAGINFGWTTGFPGVPGAVYVRATKILSDIEAGTNPVGKGFRITNTP